MRAVPILMACCAAAAASAMASSPRTNAKLVVSYLKAVKSAGEGAGERFLAPRLLIGRSGNPDAVQDVVSGAYSLYLAVQNAKVGTLHRFSCEPAVDDSVHCTLFRKSIFDEQMYRESQTYFVTNGKIYKVLMSEPEAFGG